MPLRMSTLFLRTLRDDPAEAEVASHRLLVRAGYIRRAAPGIYSWLPLGLKVLGMKRIRIGGEADDLVAGEKDEFGLRMQPADHIVDRCESALMQRAGNAGAGVGIDHELVARSSRQQ